MTTETGWHWHGADQYISRKALRNHPVDERGFIFNMTAFWVNGRRTQNSINIMNNLPIYMEKIFPTSQMMNKSILLLNIKRPKTLKVQENKWYK